MAIRSRPSSHLANAGAARKANAVLDDHWFDRLNKVLVREAPRRPTLQAIVVAAGFTLGAPLTGFARKRNKKRNKKKRKQKKRSPQQQPSCSGGACAAVDEWAGNEEEFNHCEFVCRQCDGSDPRQFCIVEGFKSDGTRTSVARCCEADQECCGDDCCGPAGQCCDLGSRGKVCISPNATCCPSDAARGICSPGEDCCPDIGCVDTQDESYCGNCVICSPGKVCVDGRCECREGLTLCGEICRDTNRDENNCGGCNLRCTSPHRPDCCDGRCVNTQFVPIHCGSCGNRCEINETCIRGNCHCIHECCNSNYSGVCVTPRTCCPEPCSRCTIGECLRWRNGIVGGYCEELANFCAVVNEYCPLVINGVHEGFFDCCGPGETCTDAGCTSTP